MKIRFIIILSVLFSGSFTLKGQTMTDSQVINSLQKKITSTAYDTSRIRLLNMLAFKYYKESKFDSCQYYASQALKLSDSLLDTEQVKNSPEYLNHTKILKVHAISKIALGFQDSNTYKKVDTLQFALKLVKETGNKDEEAAIYGTLGDVYVFRNQLQLSIKNYLMSVELYQQTGNKSKQALQLTGVAITERYLGNFGDALEYLMESLKISRQISDSATMTEALLAMSFTYLFVEKWEEALQSQQEALDIYSQMNDSLGIARVYNDMGVTNMKAGKLDVALKNHQAALAIRLHSTDYFYTSASYDYIGSIYEEKEMYQEAIRNYEEALRFAELAGFKIGIIDSHQGLGNLYLKLPDYNKALSQFLKVIDESRENDDQISEAMASIKIAEIYLAQNKTRKALDWLQRAENIVPKTSFVYLEDIYQGIAQAYFRLGDYQNAYSNLMLYSQMNDSLMVAENLEKITTLTNRLEFENKLKLQNESHNKKLQLNQAEIKRQKIVRNVSLFGMFVVLVLAVIYFIRFVEKKKLNTKLNATLQNLKSTQTQLVHAEKMASLGELTAGVAHEIQNPLNFVNNFSEVSVDLINDLVEEVNNGDTEEVKTIAGDLEQNLEKISNHGKRASSIVNGMLEHSRKGTGQKEPTDINNLAEEYLRLAYHGLRAKNKLFSAGFKTNLDESLPKLNVVPQDMGRVLLNLINNAFYAVFDQVLAKTDPHYKPLVVVSTKKMDDEVEIRVTDNGGGIPVDIIDKIFQPFFTTKSAGDGTGLGLSLSYDIITKGHNGELKVNTTKGEGTEFIIVIPKN